MNTTRTFDTGAAGYGVVNLSDLEQFEVVPGHCLSAPEMAYSTMSFRVSNENGNLAGNEEAIHEILTAVAGVIRRELTSEEYRTACVMMGKVKR